MDSFFVIESGVLALFALIIVRHIRSAAKLRNEGIKTIGIVVGHKTRLGRTTTVHPRIQFTTQIGEVVEVEGQSGIAIPQHQKGEKVVIYYEAQNPRNFTLDSEFERFAPYLGLFIVGLMAAFFIGQYIVERV